MPVMYDFLPGWFATCRHRTTFNPVKTLKPSQNLPWTIDQVQFRVSLLWVSVMYLFNYKNGEILNGVVMSKLGLVLHSFLISGCRIKFPLVKTPSRTKQSQTIPQFLLLCWYICRSTELNETKHCISLFNCSQELWYFEICSFYVLYLCNYTFIWFAL